MKFLAAQLNDARVRLEAAEREMVDVEGVAAALGTAYDCYEKLGFEARRSLLRSLVERIEVGRTDGAILLRNNLAEIGPHLFETELDGSKAFSLGADSREPWIRGSEAEIVEDAPGPDAVSDQQRMGRDS